MTLSQKTIEADFHMMSLSAHRVEADLLVHSCRVKGINKALIPWASLNIVAFILTKLNRPVKGGGRNRLSSMVLR